jgi:hypothetical protein
MAEPKRIMRFVIALIAKGAKALTRMRFIVFGSLTPAHLAGLSFAPPVFTGFAIIVTRLRYRTVTDLRH